MRFRTTLELAGKAATGLEVPEKVVTGLGHGKRPPVRVTINGYTYRTTVAPMGGRFLIPVSAAIREAADVAAGDKLNVDIEVDTDPREVSVPNDLASALKRDPAAKKAFESLSYSNKHRIVLSIEDAKTSETRQRRIARSLTTLGEP
ncbi:MAG: hypothetical protein QOE83_610 [Actinomycetota bacterium]|jgi:hypothetical protein|nr:hypothetical protein [Actinomycetota bacterium]